MSGRSSRRALLGSIFTGVVLALAATVLAAAGSPGVAGYQARVSNATDTASAVGYFSCTSAAVGDATTKAYLAYPFNESFGFTAADVSGNGRSGTYPLLGVTYGASGPCPRDGSRAITLDGLFGSVVGAATPTNPQVLSLEIWFRTTVGGGLLIGLGNSQLGSSSLYDRQLFLSNSGTVTFGVAPGGVRRTITSPATYLDGRWHDVIATLAPSTDPNPGSRLYVDGALVASDATTTSAAVNTGWWRIGYDNLAGSGPNTPTNYSFTGSLAFASTYTYALTPAQVAAHYRAGT